ncbi:DgyrCDS13566 [Dimorphilus gyrociliatus]|uniref:DgyrCDS13566 n=1 Tax=Dimorphilus gyrociliatus TaxID=2664684 RepID=A0A7I8WB11_9ANNE|nr:DgyrCDS13566 [Dimorphilus gyrociliatus]
MGLGLYKVSTTFPFVSSYTLPQCTAKSQTIIKSELADNIRKFLREEVDHHMDNNVFKIPDYKIRILLNFLELASDNLDLADQHIWLLKRIMSNSMNLTELQQALSVLEETIEDKTAEEIKDNIKNVKHHIRNLRISAMKIKNDYKTVITEIPCTDFTSTEIEEQIIDKFSKKAN